VHAIRLLLWAGGTAREGDEGARRAELDEGLLEDPAHPVLLRLLAREEGRDPLPLARRAVEGHPEDPRAWSFLAESLPSGELEGREAALRRADHSNIFLIIAGTYTPLSVMILSHHDATVLLVIVWSGALTGVVLRNAWLGAPRWLYVPIYIALGWAAIFYLPQFATAGTVTLALIIAGGVLYTVGALVYALKWPRLSERWFGFHELFHSFTIAAFLTHFAAVAITVAHRG